MSSNYDALCLSHEPAIDANGARHAEPEQALAEASRLHPRCELLLCCWSGGLVELGCPPHRSHPRHIKWVEAGWLRLAASVILTPLDPTPPELAHAIERLDHCWSPERLRKFRHLLLYEVIHSTDQGRPNNNFIAEQAQCPGGC